VQKQKILTNPCGRVDPPRVPKREMTFLDWDQAIRLAEAHSDRYRALIYVPLDSRILPYTAGLCGWSTSRGATSEMPTCSRQ